MRIRTYNVMVLALVVFAHTARADLEPSKEYKIKDRPISIKYFAGYEKLKTERDTDDSEWEEKMRTLKSCHVLMFCTCYSVRIRNPERILKALRGLPILTIGETDGFLDSGGVINFVEAEDKVHFEINNTMAGKSRLEIRSKLLRLAKRVIDEHSSEEAEN